MRDCGRVVKKEGFLSAVAVAEELNEDSFVGVPVVSTLRGVAWVQLVGIFACRTTQAICVCVCHWTPLGPESLNDAGELAAIPTTGLQQWLEGKASGKFNLFTLSPMAARSLVERLNAGTGMKKGAPATKHKIDACFGEHESLGYNYYEHSDFDHDFKDDDAEGYDVDNGDGAFDGSGFVYEDYETEDGDSDDDIDLIPGFVNK